MDARFVPDDEIQCYMNAADIVVLPYADLPINPGSLILAMGFGKPIISPAKGATPEIAGPNVLFGYDETQPDGLSGALQRALGANNLAARGREAAERALTNHSKERVAAAFGAMYARLAERLRS
jgi:glycosyltransferase involved in cell wall biosynthesis